MVQFTIFPIGLKTSPTVGSDHQIAITKSSCKSYTELILGARAQRRYHCIDPPGESVRVVTPKSTSEWKQTIRCKSRAPDQSMRQSPWTRPIHLLSLPRHSFVIRVFDFDVTPPQCDYVYGPEDTTDHVFETLGDSLLVTLERIYSSYERILRLVCFVHISTHQLTTNIATWLDRKIAPNELAHLNESPNDPGQACP